MEYPISTEKFAGILWRAILTNKITKKELRKKFGLSKPTLDRWLSGKNIPNQVMAVLVYLEMERILEEKVRQSK